jgi:hypothetical protein
MAINTNKTTPVTIRIPNEWLERINAKAANKHKNRDGSINRSQVLLDAIESFLFTAQDSVYSEGNTDSSTSLTELEQRLAALEQRFDAGKVEEIDKRIEDAIARKIVSR